MAGFYNTLRIEQFTCPPECSLCIEACAKRKGDGGLAVIKSVEKPGEGCHTVATCYQCSQPKCLEVCPTEAIIKSPTDGIVRINTEECIGCAACVDACPYGQIYFDDATSLAFKCDQCEGSPRCVEVCPYGVISLLKPGETRQYLGEDLVSRGVYLCQGCGAEIGFRFTQKVVGKGAIYFFTSGCMPLVFAMARVGSTYQGSSHYYCRMTNVASSMAGVSRYYRRIGKDVPLIAFAGDGATADIGYQGLSGAAERGDNFIYICYDNQGYMNTGIQRSGSTPRGAWTTTTPVGGPDRGKTRSAKNVPLLMAFNGAAYVATASVAFLDDYARKLKKALSVKDGMAYIHLTVPCPTGWRFPTERSVELARLAVETNMFPLWEFERGEFRLNYTPKKVKPVTEFTRWQRRFAHLKPEELDELQQMVNQEFGLIHSLTGLKQGVSA